MRHRGPTLTAANLPVESVWDYPRPPRLEPTSARIRVLHCGVTLANSTRAFRVLETSHPPVYYIPQGDIRMQHLQLSPRRPSFCEFKGLATYWTIHIGKSISHDAAWSYPSPGPAFTPLADHLAFYANHVDQCFVDDELVIPQPGDFYGGWITSNLRGPFKGAPGTLGW
jgi:uncharacterized protein (DUF427 family)